MVDDGWATGSANGRSGMFPFCQYVEFVEETTSPAKPSRSTPTTPSTPTTHDALGAAPATALPLDKGLCGRGLYEYVAG